MKVGHHLTQILIILVFHVKSGLARFEAGMIVLNMQCRVVLITVVVFVSVNEGDRIRSIHKLFISIDAWL